MCCCREASRRGDLFTETSMTKDLGKSSPEEQGAVPRPSGSGGLWTRACPVSRERAVSGRGVRRGGGQQRLGRPGLVFLGDEGEFDPERDGDFEAGNKVFLGKVTVTVLG